MDEPALRPATDMSLARPNEAVHIDVGNLAAVSTRRQLSDLFAPHGEVAHVEVVGNDPTGRTSTRAVIVMPQGADAAIAAVNGQRLNGMKLRVRKVRNYNDLASFRAAIEKARNG